MTNRTNRKKLLAAFLTALHRGLADFAYGINAGNAIRHGLPVPRRGAPDHGILPMAGVSSPVASRPAAVSAAARRGPCVAGAR